MDDERFYHIDVGPQKAREDIGRRAKEFLAVVNCRSATGSA